MYPASSRYGDRRRRRPAARRSKFGPAAAVPSVLEQLEHRRLLSAAAPTPFGTPGSWNDSGNDYTKAFDGNPATYFDAPTAQAYAGLDYGTPTTVDQITFYPRAGAAWRMIGGMIQGSNDGTTWTNLLNQTIRTAPEGQYTTLNVNYLAPFQYVRYVSPDGGYGNVAELQFHTRPNDSAPAAPSHVYANYIAQPTSVDLDYHWDDEVAGYFEVQLSTTPDFSNVIRSQTTTDPYVNFDGMPGGTYYFRVRAVNYGDGGASDYTVASPNPQVVSPLPAAVSDLTYTINTDNSVTFNWTDNATNESGYLAVFSTDPSDLDYLGRNPNLPPDATSVTFATNPGWSTYYFWIHPTSPDGVPSPVKLTVNVPSKQAPIAPQNVSAAQTAADTIRFSWQNFAQNADGQEWQVSTSADFSTVTRSGSLGPDAYTLAVDQLPPGTYYFRVRNINAAGPSAYAGAPAITLAAPSTDVLTGTPIGTPGSWHNLGADLTMALDGNVNTYFDAATPDAWVGEDLGTPAIITSVRFYPRQGAAWRMVNGIFQGSYDGTDWVNLVTVKANDVVEGQYTTLPVSLPTAFRYVRYLSPDQCYGNVAEIEFHGTHATTPELTPAAPTDVTWQAGSHSLTFNWTDNATNETSYWAELNTSPDFARSTAMLAYLPNANTTTASFNYYLKPGQTYYFRVRAVLTMGESTFYSDYATTSLTYNPPASDALTGSVIGTPGSWGDSGNDRTKAFDGDTATAFDAPVGQAWTGLDLGTPAVVTSVRFYPRATVAWRMVGGQFQGSNDGSTWTTLATVTSEPAEGQYTTLPVSDPTAYRYVRYLSAEWGYGNVAEVEFHGHTGSAAPPPAAPTGVFGINAGSGEAVFEWADVADETGYEYQLSTSPAFATTLRSGSNAADSVHAEFDNLSPGTYYFRVRAVNAAGASAYSVPALLTLPPTGSDGSVLLTGTGTGTAGSWNNLGNDFTKALDGDPSTFFDAPTSQAFVGMNFDEPHVVTSVRFYPRAGYADRMVGGVFQGSNDYVHWTTLATVTGTPPNGQYTTLAVTDPTAYRSVRYLSPVGGLGNVAEIQFYGLAAAAPPAAPTGVTGTNRYPNEVEYIWDDVANESGYEYQLSTSPAFDAVVRSGTLPYDDRVFTDYGIAPGTYYFRVRAANSAGASAYTEAAPLTLSPDTNQAPAPLTGTGIGTAGSWNNLGNDFTKALDGDPNTFFDAPTAGPAYVGLHLDGYSYVTSVHLTPRAGYADRVVGGKIQVSEDGVNWTTAYTIDSAPADGVATTYVMSNAFLGTYVRYLAPDGGYGNVADVVFYGLPVPPPLP